MKYYVRVYGFDTLCSNGIELDGLLKDLQRRGVPELEITIRVQFTGTEPETLAEAIEKGRRDYLRVTGQTE